VTGVLARDATLLIPDSAAIGRTHVLFKAGSPVTFDHAERPERDRFLHNPGRRSGKDLRRRGGPDALGDVPGRSDAEERFVRVRTVRRGQGVHRLLHQGWAEVLLGGHQIFTNAVGDVRCRPRAHAAQLRTAIEPPRKKWCRAPSLPRGVFGERRNLVARSAPAAWDGGRSRASSMRLLYRREQSAISMRGAAPTDRARDPSHRVCGPSGDSTARPPSSCATPGTS
jgi:hypothetical protein